MAAQIIPSSYFRMIARELEVSVSMEELLAGTELDAGSIVLIDTISLEQLLVILGNARRVTGNPAVGLQLGSLLHPSMHGSVGWATINSPTLADAIEALSLYSNLQVPFISYGASVDNDWFSIRITPLMDLADQHTVLVECALLLLQHVIEYVVGHQLADARISVDYPPPPYADQYDDFFGCPVVFEQDCVQLAVPRAYQDLPCFTANEDMYQIAIDQCRTAQRRLRECGDAADTVYDLLEKHLEDHLTLEQVAYRMHVSPRTLIRRLKKRGTSFQAISDRLYAQTAADYMNRTDISVNGVAQLLGYKDPANFRRSFKRWFRMTPASYREQHG